MKRIEKCKMSEIPPAPAAPPMPPPTPPPKPPAATIPMGPRDTTPIDEKVIYFFEPKKFEKMIEGVSEEKKTTLREQNVNKLTDVTGEMAAKTALKEAVKANGGSAAPPSESTSKGGGGDDPTPQQLFDDATMDKMLRLQGRPRRRLRSSATTGNVEGAS